MVIEKDNDVVYHYCSVEAFLNIIQSSTLWLSDVLKSNDIKEETWIREKINDKIEKLLAEIDLCALEAWNTWYKINNTLSGTIYASCFSQQKDCLSQWRGYAQDGQGMAIGFSKEFLQLLNKPYFIKFEKVIYKERIQNKFINKIVNENIKKMTRTGVGHAAHELTSNYFLSFPLYKNPSFEDENEWRIILLSHPDHQKNGVFSDFKFLAPKFRVNNGSIISYIEMDFSNIKRKFIKEIWIGPKSKITKKDIVYLLAAKGYYKDTPYNENGPILIEYSKSSYR